MFDIKYDIHTSGTQDSGTIDPLAEFVRDHQNALLNAAALLAGRTGLRLAQAVIDETGERCSLPQSVMRGCRALLGIYTLENVHDLTREESAFFARIDPASPYVEEICLLADGLRCALDESMAAKI